MKLFLDTANIEEIKQALSWGVISGVTTNPTLVSREGDKDFHSLIREICDLVKGPVSAEVISLDADGMIREAEELASLSEHVVIKIPMTPEGMKAVSVLSKEGIKTNVTLVFSVEQALLAANAGATYVSPFIGRLDDIGGDGVGLVADIVSVFKRGNFETQVIAASIRHTRHVRECALIGAHIATVPFNVLRGMFVHPLTDIGIQRFLKDWESFKNRAR
ncbi:MAG: fructose-6-phosphate aldolase [Synergistetes bacterium]|nr:MAG: putative transaldolase [bacterium 42_11]MBC7331734.1 fructose-6-phosphate aldolase [Synergistota bacterium]MDK2871323.1 transaldolase [bacterium]